MSTIDVLEAQINILEDKIKELKKEAEGLYAFRSENRRALQQVEEQAGKRYKFAEQFLDIKGKTTLAKGLIDMVDVCYGTESVSQLLSKYEDIHADVNRAIRQVEEEIEGNQKAIKSYKAKITEMKEVNYKREMEAEA